LGVAHIAVFAADYEKSRAFYRDFLGFEEPYSLPKPDGTPSMTFFKINERQYIELFPQTAAGTDRLNHISIETDNAEAMRRYLAARGIAVPERVGKGRIGNSNFNVKDPEGHTVEIVQYEPDGWTVRERGRHLPESRISSHMLHAGIIVTRFDAEMRFYRDLLGFREIWRGTRSGGNELSWVNLQVPDGDDYIELMLYKDAPAPDRRGTAHHLALEVPDIAAAIAALEAKPSRKEYTREIQSQTGVNRKRQSNLYDPDGTRVELMEPRTVDGQPAPASAFAPPDSPEKDASLGLFEAHAEVGTVLHGGAVEYDSAKRTYTVAGSGDNMWARSDAFHYVFKKVSGDVALTADIAILGTGGDAHRKGVLMIRQSLDADSAYVDAALHGNGLTSIQARDEKGAITHEVQSYVSAPRRLRIVKSGSDFFVSVAGEGEELHPGGGSMSVKLTEPFYVGIGVCAHNKDAVEKVVFSNISLSMAAPAKPELYSTLVVVRLAAAPDHRALVVLPGRIEAPAWTPDGTSLIFKRDGKTYRVPADGGQAEEVDATQTSDPQRSEQVTSPDGRRIAFVSYQLIPK
jgi:catechol 2,3-dioxygenase-like lactoylglutathione lyase family enzyme